MVWLVCIFYAVVGIIIGAIFALLFIRMDQQWKTYVLSSVGLPLFLGILNSINEYMDVSENKALFYPASMIYILFLLITIFAVMVITGYLIKSQAGIVKIRFLDILLGYNKCLEQYYNSRKVEVDKMLNYDEQIAIKHETERLIAIQQEKEKILNEQLNDSLFISLPLNSRMPINNRFLSCIPGYANNLLHFYHSIESNTEMFCKQYKKGKTDDLEFLFAYLSSICIDINTKLFNDSANHIRTHFRVKKDESYVKFIAFKGSSKFDNDLTEIPIDSGMIKTSFENKCSLIKSQNISLHYRATNDGIWRNYISFAIYDVSKDGYPLLTIGISVSDEALYNDMLYFINFCQVERIISNCIAQIDQVCNINKVVDIYFKGLENENAK